MNRRTFLSHMSILAGMGMAPKSVLALGTENATTQSRFQAALKIHPELIGYANYTQERTVDALHIEGQFPASFNGRLFRNGPALFERQGVRYEHLFEGDGMIHAFTFKDGGVSFQNRFVQTSKYQAEQAADRFLYDFSGLGLKDPSPITSADSINPGNTSVLPVGDEIWALWEAGSAHAMNPETLETKGRVTLGEGLKGMPFSAHPKVEADGTIWNFGLDYGSGRVILYRLSATGQLQKYGVVNAGYHAMLHDFLVTEKHLLLILPSITMDRNAKSFMQQQRFDANQAMRVMVIDKNDLTVRSTHEFPACFLFHFGNAWEDRDGTIHFDGSRYRDLEIMNVIGDVMAGKARNNSQAFGQTTLFSIRPDGTTAEQQFAGMSEFPRIYPSMTGRANQKVFTIGGPLEGGWMHSVRALDVHTGAVDEFDYGNEYLVEEHIVIERGSKPEQGGWLLGTALHWPTQRTCVSLFQADQISAGPMARAWLPFHLPLSFHGNFAASA